MCFIRAYSSIGKMELKKYNNEQHERETGVCDVRGKENRGNQRQQVYNQNQEDNGRKIQVELHAY